MNDWQRKFAEKVNSLREQSMDLFEVFADDSLAPVFREFSEFAGQWSFRAHSPQAQRGLRVFKFALTENSYVLLTFRHGGVGEVSCEHECVVPGRGRLDGSRATESLAGADHEWVHLCFRNALDCLVDSLAQANRAPETEEALAV